MCMLSLRGSLSTAQFSKVIIRQRSAKTSTMKQLIIIQHRDGFPDQLIKPFNGVCSWIDGKAYSHCYCFINGFVSNRLPEQCSFSRSGLVDH